MLPSLFPRFLMRYGTTLLFAGLLALAGCAETAGPASKIYTYTLPETPGGRLCTNQCREAQDYCYQSCGLSQRDCTGKIQGQALLDYDKYTRDQFATHQPIELRPRDFERMGDCDAAKTGCTGDCDDHYRLCYQNCGGKVDMTTSCQALCF